MKSIKHVTNTWLVALHLFPVLVLFYILVSSGSAEIGMLLFVALFGAVFSLPSFLLCLFFITPVLKAPLPSFAKLCLWMLTVSLSISINAALICYALFDCIITWQELPFVGCAVLAALIAILLRLQFFYQIAILQTNEYEKDLV